MSGEELVWFKPPNATRFHLIEDGRSLCGRYGFIAETRGQTFHEGDEFRGGKDCKKCCRKAGLVE